jgi:signal transduction histidine kinase
MDADRSTAVFRIFQETLTNIARHAHADRVLINLVADEEEFMLRVRDNGSGITAENISAPNSFGLMGIRERAHYWGGAVEFHGEPDNGTTVTVTIPFEKAGAVS